MRTGLVYSHCGYLETNDKLKYKMADEYYKNSMFIVFFTIILILMIAKLDESIHILL